MSNELEVSKTFQDKMFEKIRSQMGDLMNDDDLKRLVEVSLKKAFFEPIITKREYGREDVIESPFLSMIRKLMQERVLEETKIYIEAHSEEINELIKNQLGKGILGVVQGYLEVKMQQPMWQLQESLRTAGFLK